MRTTTSQVRCTLTTSCFICGQRQASSCLLNKCKWGNRFFFCPDNFLFLMLCHVNLISWSGPSGVFQASRVSRPCGILATRCTLTSSPPTWSTCLQCPCTNLLPRPPGDPSALWPLSQPNPPTIAQNLKKSAGAYKFVKYLSQFRTKSHSVDAKDDGFVPISCPPYLPAHVDGPACGK